MDSGERVGDLIREAFRAGYAMGDAEDSRVALAPEVDLTGMAIRDEFAAEEAIRAVVVGVRFSWEPVRGSKLWCYPVFLKWMHRGELEDFGFMLDERAKIQGGLISFAIEARNKLDRGQG